MKLELNVKRFNNKDVIATSGKVTYTISGLGDFDGTTFGFTSSDGVYNYTSASALQDSGDNILYKNFYYTNNAYCPLYLILELPAKVEEGTKDPFFDNKDYYNGTYIFDGTNYVKQ